MKPVGSRYCILAAVFCLNLMACFGTACIKTIEQHGETSVDFELPVGAELTINCSLHNLTLPGIDFPINSSYIVFNGDITKYRPTHVDLIDEMTAQFTIHNVQPNNSDVYHCKLRINDDLVYVCGTSITVGYPPQDVSNFKCLIRNFDNLTCSWDIKHNEIKTDYTVSKTVFIGRLLQDCPQPHNNTFCLWNYDSTPPYISLGDNLTFIIRGRNSLGTFYKEVVMNHFEIVLPNHPDNFSVVAVSKNSVSLTWNAPAMKHIAIYPSMYYQIWLQEHGPDPKDKIVVEAGVNTSHFVLEDLIPNYQYKVLLRCRLNASHLWSSFATLIFKTDPDVPYTVPVINPSAFVMHNFGVYRNTTLYWKPVPEKRHNGDDFYYHVTYSQIKERDSSTYFVNSKRPFVKIGYLHNDTAYIFRIHSANRVGISENFTSITIDNRESILPSAKDIRAISNGLGQYNLSWDKVGPLNKFNYTVFWCISRKPGICDGPIQWTDGVLKESTFSLSVHDVNSNFQFAIAASMNNQSSGMQWASCVVPVKAPLGQIPISHIEAASTTLRIMWKLDCEAQKSVIDRYVITYCREPKDCKNAVAEPDTMTYTLRDLQPFSEYSIKLRAFNKENKPSEDVDEMYKNTLSAAPSDTPQNVSIISKTNSSFLVSWTPPLEPNGVIKDYIIYYNKQENHVAEESCKTCVFHVEGLKEYTLYNVSIQACVEAEDMKTFYCSSKSPPIAVLTDVGVPGKMEAPRIETVNMTHLKVSWPAPTVRNGPIEFYEVQLKNMAGNETGDQIIQEESLSTIIDFDCFNLLEGGLTYQFYVRAVNKKNGSYLYGPYSEPIKATTCVMPQGLAMSIGIAIGGTFALAIFLLFLCKLVKWMREKIHQVKNIAVRLPKELEGPETNPLNNYESFKHGLVQTIHNGKVVHPPYALNESDNKNRHGSGSSQFSNASTDELIFKNGKCTKFGRKPSGDSSGCSSMTSNTTTRLQLSSDSGTESDFMVPPSPDSVSNELPAPNGQKPHMPILMEVHDPLDTAKAGFNDQLEKYNLISGMALKVDHPYSKFGISGNVSSSVPCQINPLAFYSGNLANSEPSVFEAQSSSARKLPGRPLYSKLGYAKSSGDILSSRSKEIGYSKFGFDAPQECFSIDVESLNPVVSMAIVEDQSLTNRDGKRLQESLNYPQSDSQDSNRRDAVEMNPMPNRPSSGYVQVGGMRSMKEMDTISVSTSSLDEDDSPFQIPQDLGGEFSDLSSVWTTGLNEISDQSVPSNSSSPVGLYPGTLSSQSSGVVQVVPSSSASTNDSPSRNGSCKEELDFSDVSDTPVCNVKPCVTPTISNGSVSQHSKTGSSPEVLLMPSAGRNGYVPFSTLSSMCEPSVPMTGEPNVPLSIFPGGDIGTDQNYITPSNKGELRLLQEGLISNSKPFSPFLHCNGNKMRKISVPLKHILKPKMESEICEV